MDIEDYIDERKRPETMAEDMSQKERIDFIREFGTEEMKDGLKSVLNGNKYKLDREEMWKKRLFRGKKMVKLIIRKHLG